MVHWCRRKPRCKTPNLAPMHHAADSLKIHENHSFAWKPLHRTSSEQQRAASKGRFPNGPQNHVRCKTWNLAPMHHATDSRKFIKITVLPYLPLSRFKSVRLQPGAMDPKNTLQNTKLNSNAPRCRLAKIHENPYSAWKPLHRTNTEQRAASKGRFPNGPQNHVAKHEI